MQTAANVMTSPDAHYVTTASGQRVSLLDPSPDDIQIRDIAAALARTCQAPGAPGGGFYSAAQHAIEVRRQLGDGKAAIYGLLSNARVAYLGRTPSPLMLSVGESLLGFGEIERRFDATILKAVGLAPLQAESEMAQRIARATKIIEATESRDILGGMPRNYAGPQPRPTRLVPLVGRQPAAGFWDKAEAQYLREFWALELVLGLQTHRHMMR